MDEEERDEEDSAFGRLGDLLVAFDDTDYDNILEDDDVRSQADLSSVRKFKKPRKAQQLPEKFALIYKRGVDLYLNNQHEEALETFSEIAHGVKTYAPLYNQMADCLQSLGRMEEALECCRQCVLIDPQFVEAWARYVELAELMELREETVHGLKKYIRLSLEKGDSSVLPHIRRLIELLESDKTSSSLKCKKLLFHLQFKAGNKAECFLLAISISRFYLSNQKVDLAMNFLQPIFSTAENSTDCEEMPEELFLAFLEVLLEKKKFEEAFRILKIFKLIQLIQSNKSKEEFRVQKIERVEMKEEAGVPLVAAVCIVLTEFGNFAAVADLLQKRILSTDRFPNSTLFLSLADSLIEKDETAVAGEILDRLYLQVEFHTAEFYFRLGKIYENREKTMQAFDAYNRAVSLRPGFRPARFRIRRLGLPLPKAANLGTAQERQRTILIQKRIHEDFLFSLTQQDDEETLRLVLDLVSSTFAHLEEIDYKDLVYSLYSPARLEEALESLILYAPSIATKDVPFDDFWNVIMHGCFLAFKLKNYEDLLQLGCWALRTADFKPFLEKSLFLQRAVLLSVFYDGQPFFCLRYFRDRITTSRKANLSVSDWNFFYQLTVDGGTGQVLYKWATRWVGLYGYSRQILMVLANDSMRRGNYRHSFELYNTILKKEGIQTVPWYILLYVGILYVNFACAVHCGSRVRLYTTGMFFLEKYGSRRGVCPEVSYNKGRAAHQFGDLSEAMRFYEDCLELCDKTTINAPVHDSAVLDFKFPALYNLRALYVRNGNLLHVKRLYKERLSWKAIRPAV